MAKRRRLFTIPLGNGREYRIRALKSCHPVLRYIDGLSPAIVWILDWAIDRLWHGMSGPVPVQRLIADRLSESGHPWSEENDPLPTFAEQALMSTEQITGIIDGRRPSESDGEISALASVLDVDVDELLQLVRRQYGAPMDVKTESLESLEDPHGNEQPDRDRCTKGD